MSGEEESGKIALITGASRGIGRAIAVAIAGLGYDFFLSGRDENGLNETADLIRKASASASGGRFGCGEGPLIAIHSQDLSYPDSAERLFSAFSAGFDRLDLLVNNAGTVVTKKTGNYTAQDWDLVMNVNARTPFFLMQQAAVLLEKAEPGFIINIGSVVSHKGYEDQALYSASKHALLGATKAIARDLKETSIRVHMISPGGVATDMARRVRPDINEAEMISPEEIAETVIFLLRMKGNAAIDEISVRRKSRLPWD